MLISIISIIVLLVLDQLTKYFAVIYLKPVGSADFIKGLLGWHYVENTGMAFSFFQGKRVLLIILTSIALIALLVILFYKKPNNKFAKIGLILTFSGGMGNLIDRIYRGYVVDFANFEFVNFAVFNFADVLVTCGVACLMVYIISSEVKTSKSNKKENLETADTVNAREASENE